MVNSPHWFAVNRLSDNRLSGLMREIAEIIDDETNEANLYDLRKSLHCLGDGAGCKGWRIKADREKGRS